MGDLSSLALLGITALGGSILLASESATVPISLVATAHAKNTEPFPAPLPAKVLEPTERTAGRIYLSATIASAPTRMMIDTGASHTILSEQDALRAQAVRMRAATVATAGGMVTMQVARVSGITIGEETIGDVEVLVSDKVGESLLGLDVLDRLGATHLSLSPN